MGDDSILIMGDPGGRAAGPSPATTDDSISFLLVQLGFHTAQQFGERLAPLGLEQRHAGMLARLAASQGESQQAIAELMGVNATRMVFLVDELEKLGLVERRRNPGDRRSHALYLTDAGTAMLARVRAVTAEHEARIRAGLTRSEQTRLLALLRKVAGEQGLSTQGLPGMPPARSPAQEGGATPRWHGSGRGPSGRTPGN
jgi:DNA-binding MarR family transcriptional regulator